MEPTFEIVSLEGPIELFGDQLALRIPLGAGGDKLAPLARGISVIEDGFLNVIIKPWLAEKLNVALGSLAVVDNKDGKFNITRSAANDSGA